MRWSVLGVILIAMCGCATVFHGYTTNIEIQNAPDSLQVATQDGLILSNPTYATRSTGVWRPDLQQRQTIERVDSSARFVRVRSNRDYVLQLKTANGESRYLAYAKINLWWVALDCVCGGVPLIVDAITGNWNYYDPIVYRR